MANYGVISIDCLCITAVLPTALKDVKDEFILCRSLASIIPSYVRARRRQLMTIGCLGGCIQSNQLVALERPRELLFTRIFRITLFTCSAISRHHDCCAESAVAAAVKAIYAAPQWLAEATPYRFSAAALRIPPSRLSTFIEPCSALLGLNLQYPKEISFRCVSGDWQDWESRRCSSLYLAESVSFRVFDRCTDLELSHHERQEN